MSGLLDALRLPPFAVTDAIPTAAGAGGNGMCAMTGAGHNHGGCLPAAIAANAAPNGNGNRESGCPLLLYSSFVGLQGDSCCLPVFFGFVSVVSSRLIWLPPSAANNDSTSKPDLFFDALFSGENRDEDALPLLLGDIWSVPCVVGDPSTPSDALC